MLVVRFFGNDIVVLYIINGFEGNIKRLEEYVLKM